MRKNIIKKTLLLIPLILGLTACKNGGDPSTSEGPNNNQKEIFADPEPFEVVDVLDQKEIHKLQSNIYKKLEDAIELETIVYQKRFMDEAPNVQVITSGNYHAKVYQNNDFEMTAVFQAKARAENGLELVMDEGRHQIKNAWKDDIVYTMTVESVDGYLDHDYEKQATDLETYTFNKLSFPVQMMVIGFMGDLEEAMIVTDKNNNYRIFIELGSYEVYPSAGIYTHYYEGLLYDIVINQEFEITRLFFSEVAKVGYFNDAKARPIKELDEIVVMKFGTRVTYGTKVKMPNLDEFIASFPVSAIERDLAVTYLKNSCVIDEDTGEIVIGAELPYSLADFGDSYRSKTGGIIRDIFEPEEVTLFKGEALKIAVDYVAMEAYEETPVAINYRDYIDFVCDIPAEYGEALKVVTKDDIQYLAYLPSEESGLPNQISLGIDLIFEIQPYLNSSLEPCGELTIKSFKILLD